MPEISSARVVIIGGGVVGASILYHLAKNGWSDCVLLEKNELTAGSTWHAAGNCPNYSTSFGIMNMQRYGLALYRGLAQEVDYPINYHVSGAVRLAHSHERMMEFEHVASMGRYMGLKMDICTPQELQSHMPFMEIHDLEGGLWDPLDGDIDPAQVTQALAKGARKFGGTILRFTPAIGIERVQNEWCVKTEKGDITCEYVVNAAGYYANKISEWFLPYGGRPAPMAVMSHQYFLTDSIPELNAWSEKHGRKVPMLRDVDSSYYLRQEVGGGLNLGPYERNCKAHWIADNDPMPDDFSFQLYPDDLDRLEWYIEDAMERVPLLGTQGVKRNINGPIPYAPDGLPLLGPMPGVKNAFEAHSFTFGIAQGGGAGKVLAEWIMHGQTEWDMWAVDPRRFTAHTDPQYCIDKAMETYGHEYAMHFPHHVWPAGRDRKLSPNHDRLLKLGGQMGCYNGWERANWFAKAGDDISEEATQTWAREGPWQIRIKEECEAVRDNVGVLDLPGFSRFSLNGTGAAEWLRCNIAGALPKIGRMTLGYFLNDKGRIITEMSIMRHGEDEFTLITAALAQWHDRDFLYSILADELDLKDITDERTTLIVAGPKSRDLLGKISDADLSLNWLSLQKATIAKKDALFARVCFAGELGWEVHAKFEDIAAIYEAILGAGATPFGMFALDSLRLEKGYRSWKGDLSSDYTLIESGLARFARPDKAQNFSGKAALKAELASGSVKQFASLIVEAQEYDAPYMSNIIYENEIVGQVTSGGWGYRINASIAHAIIRSDLIKAGTEVEIEIYGKRMKATVQPDGALWDADNSRIRA